MKNHTKIQFIAPRCKMTPRQTKSHQDKNFNQDGGGGTFYSIKFGRWIIMDFGGHVCSVCCPFDQTAHRVTDKTKFLPTNFLLFSGYETPNITCTAWKHVRSYHDGCQFWGNFGFYLLFCFCMWGRRHIKLRAVIWCSSKSPCCTPRTPLWRW